MLPVRAIPPRGAASPRPARRKLARGVAAVAVVLCCAAPVAWPYPPGAMAQSQIGPLYVLRLTHQPLWYEPGAKNHDRLRLAFTVTNNSTESLAGFRLTIAAGSRVASRSSLDAINEGRAFATSTPLTADFAGTKVPSGGSVTVPVGGRIEDLGTLGSVTDGGVYPLSVTLQDLSSTVPLDQLTSPLILYPRTPDPPLHLVPVVALNEPPSRDARGTFTLGASGHVPLANELAPKGSLSGLMNALRRSVARSDLRLGLAPSPRLVEEVADMSNGYRRSAAGGATATVGANDPAARAAARFLETLRRLLGGAQVQGLLAPYSWPDLPELTANTSSAPGVTPLVQQLTEANDVLRSATGHPVSPAWLFPPGGRLSSDTLDELRAAGAARHTFFDDSSVGAPLEGCPEPSGTLTFACPIKVSTTSGATDGYVGDSGLQELLVSLNRGGSDTRLLMQRFFAETAMIREEQPNVARRVVEVTIPPSWRPSPAAATRFYSGLARAPWLRTVSPSQGLGSASPAQRQVVRQLDTPPGAPQPVTYWPAIAAAQSTVDDLASMDPPSSVLQLLRRDLLVAQGSTWWGTPSGAQRALAYAAGARRAAQGIEDMVTLPEVNRGQTLTSHSGDLQIVVFNDAPFPLTVSISLESSKLGFKSPVIERRLAAGKTQRLALKATARSSGTFPLNVSIDTPGGGTTIATQSIEIRSTNFNRIALVITGGALVFLVFFYVSRWIRRRRHPGKRHDTHQEPSRDGAAAG